MIVSIIVLLSEIIFLLVIITYSIKKKVLPTKNANWYFIPMIIIMFVLYSYGRYNDLGKTLSFIDLSKCANAAISSFVFEVKDEYVSSYLAESITYSWAFYIGYILSISTSILFGASLFVRQLKNRLGVLITKTGDYDVLVTDEPSVLSYKRSYKNTLY